MRRLQRFGNLLRDHQRFINRDRAMFESSLQRFAFDQFHHQEHASAGLFDAVDRGNAGIVQRRQHARLALESRCTFGIVGEFFRKKFDRHAAAQLRVRGLIHVPHASAAEMRRDFVMCEFGSDHDPKNKNISMKRGILSEPPQITSGSRWESTHPLSLPYSKLFLTCSRAMPSMSPVERRSP